MNNMVDEKAQSLGILQVDFSGADTVVTTTNRKMRKQIERAYEREVKHERVNYIPGPRYASDGKGARRKFNLRGSLKIFGRKQRITTFTMAAAYPFTASSTHGVPGACIGVDEEGGGAFYFDPWELYAAGIIKGMSAVVLGSVGMGKSTCVKSTTSRLVLSGRKATVMSDKKGEWDIVAAYLGGNTITVGAGSETRINVLDEGNRPSYDTKKRPMTDKKWAKTVATRRLTLLRALAEILEERRLSSAEIKALSFGLRQAVAVAEGQGRVPIIPDFIEAIASPDFEALGSKNDSPKVRQAFETLYDTFTRLIDGDLEGMFDGESTVTFDANAPIVTFNTQSLDDLPEEARKIAFACIQSWAEAAITSGDFGKRLVIYEEGSEVLNDPGSLRRMVSQWKLARAYGIFNILVLHKLGDLDLAGDAGSKTRADAYSLLGDSAVRIVYHQESDQKALAKETLGLTEREWQRVTNFKTGQGLWKLSNDSFVVRNTMTAPEVPIFNTDQKIKTAA